MANKRTIIEVSRGLMSIPRIDERVALAIADNATVVAAAAAAVDANPAIATHTAAIARVDPGTTGTAGQYVARGPSGPVWMRDRVLDVTHPRFGAKGDGVTNDTAAINAANTAAGTSGAVIFFPPGTYITSATIFPNTNTTWQGVWGKSIILAKPGITTFNMFQINDNRSGVVFNDLVIDLNKPNTIDSGAVTVGIGIYYPFTTSQPTGSAVRRCVVRNGYQYGIRMNGYGSLNPLANIENRPFDLVDNEIHNWGRIGILTVGTRNMRIRGNMIHDNGESGVQVDASAGMDISGNWCWRNGAAPGGNSSHGITVNYGMEFTLTENRCWENWNWGIAIGGGDPTRTENRRFVVANNVARGNGTSGSLGGGITCDPSITGLGATKIEQWGVFSANVCNNNGPYHGLYLQNVGKATLIGNIACGNVGYGIMAHASDTTISGNITNANGTGGLYLSGSTGAGRHRLGGDNLSLDNGGGNVQAFMIDAGVTDISYADNGRVHSVTDSGPVETLPHVMAAGVSVVTLTDNCTLNFPQAFVGARFTLRLVQDGTGSRTVTWPATVRWTGGVAPTLTATANRADVFRFVSYDGVRWTGEVVGQNYDVS